MAGAGTGIYRPDCVILENRHIQPKYTCNVEETGIVDRIKPSAKAIELTVRAKVCGRGVKVGDSIAVNGCCLTVVKLAAAKGGKIDPLRFAEGNVDANEFCSLRAWVRRVNLERSLQVGARLGGHFVTGHIDGVGKIIRWEKAGQDHVLEIAAPADVMRYLVFKEFDHR